MKVETEQAVLLFSYFLASVMALIILARVTKMLTNLNFNGFFFQDTEYRILVRWSNRLFTGKYWTCFQYHCHLHPRQTSLPQNISFFNDAFIVLGFWTAFLQPIFVCSTGTEWIIQKRLVPTIGTLLDPNGSNLSFRILFYYCCSNCWKVNIRFIYSGFNTFSLLLRKNI